MIWLLLAVGCGSCLLGYVVGAALPTLDDDESLVAAFFADLAITEQDLEDEREHSEALAAALANVLYMSDHGDGTGFRAGVERAVAALRAHDGAHR